MEEIIVALAGNPNVGKSTVFNALTGMRQHTGNWPGKTVSNARGVYEFNNTQVTLVDLPGTYSLYASSVEEEIARDYLYSGEPNLVVCVTDATCLKRNLNLVLQIREITDRVVVCVNLLDEAKKKKIRVDLKKLSTELGLPVVGTAARSNKGLDELMTAVDQMARSHEGPMPAGNAARPGREGGDEKETKSPDKVDSGNRGEGENGSGPKARSLSQDTDEAVRRIVRRSNEIYAACVSEENLDPHSLDRRLDRILTSRFLGYPIMILLLGLIFWITITGANYPSELLSRFFQSLQEPMLAGLSSLGAPQQLQEALVLGIYKTLSWVVSVMLPPMAIFFPLFTLLEDSGYLPRVAFNMDRCFQKAKAHGKQSLTMW